MTSNIVTIWLIVLIPALTFGLSTNGPNRDNHILNATTPVPVAIELIGNVTEIHKDGRGISSTANNATNGLDTENDFKKSSTYNINKDIEFRQILERIEYTKVECLRYTNWSIMVLVLIILSIFSAGWNLYCMKGATRRIVIREHNHNGSTTKKSNKKKPPQVQTMASCIYEMEQELAPKSGTPAIMANK